MTRSRLVRRHERVKKHVAAASWVGATDWRNGSVRFQREKPSQERATVTTQGAKAGAMMHEWASRKDVANALQGTVRTYGGRFRARRARGRRAAPRGRADER